MAHHLLIRIHHSNDALEDSLTLDTQAPGLMCGLVGLLLKVVSSTALLPLIERN